MLSHRIATLAPAAALLLGCPSTEPTEPAGEDGMDDAADGGTDGADTGAVEESGGETVDPNAPTFYGDVLPMFVEHCSACHVPGGLGPYNLEDYETAKGIAEVIQTSTEIRTMPPFPADNTGECNTYQSARWLSDEQIDLIAQWVEGGAQEGDPDTPRPAAPELPTLKGNDLIELSTPEGYKPIVDQSGPLDDYQCFLGEVNNGDTTRYITGFEVIPGNPAVTHHMVGFLVNLEGDSAVFGSNRSLIQVLDDASPDQPGWDCFGAAGQGVLVEGTPVTWAPGAGAFNFPEGTGIRIDPGYGLVLQTHYNLANGDGEDTTLVRLSMADEVEREAVNALNDHFLISGLQGSGLEIPPGEKSWVYQWDARVMDFNSKIGEWDKVVIFGALPHMHELGRRMQVSYFSGQGAAEETCGMYVDRWDFDWQRAYMYTDPITLLPTDTISVTCEWDTSSKTTPTKPGLGTQNEMCLYGIYAAEG